MSTRVFVLTQTTGGSIGSAGVDRGRKLPDYRSGVGGLFRTTPRDFSLGRFASDAVDGILVNMAMEQPIVLAKYLSAFVHSYSILTQSFASSRIATSSWA
jgi:hypothetical protein